MSTVLHLPPQRKLGAYYTPRGVADVITKWAIRSHVDRVLDPSFGGCAFVDSAVARLRDLDADDPGRLVHGVDVDQECKKFVQDRPELSEANFVYADFLQLASTTLGGKFDCIVGNPPFVRHHWMKRSPEPTSKRAGLPQTSSMWALFVAHALEFVQAGGRLAMLVSDAVLQAKYATKLRNLLAGQFARVNLVLLTPRFFENTQERVVLIAAEGFGSAVTTVPQVHCAENLTELDGLLSAIEEKVDAARQTLANGTTIDREAIDVLGEARTHRGVQRFQDVATVQLGLVTGSNQYFIRTATDVLRYAIPADALVPVVTRSDSLVGIDFTREDFEQLVRAGRPAYLVRPRVADQRTQLARWISDGETLNIHDRFKCRNRAEWYRVPLVQRPDAFFAPMHQHTPRLAINTSNARCSNTLYAVYWKNLSTELAKSVCVGMVTSMSRVIAELGGTRYGGGLLKIAVSAVSSLPVVVSESAHLAFDSVTQLLRGGNWEMARVVADDAVLKMALGMSDRSVQILRDASLKLARQRKART